MKTGDAWTEPSTAGNYLRNRINGAVASKYREDGDEYDIKVRYAPEYRTSLESLEKYPYLQCTGTIRS